MVTVFGGFCLYGPMASYIQDYGLAGICHSNTNGDHLLRLLTDMDRGAKASSIQRNRRDKESTSEGSSTSRQSFNGLRMSLMGPSTCSSIARYAARLRTFANL